MRTVVHKLLKQDWKHISIHTLRLDSSLPQTDILFVPRYLHGNCTKRCLELEAGAGSSVTKPRKWVQLRAQHNVMHRFELSICIDCWLVTTRVFN